VRLFITSFVDANAGGIGTFIGAGAAAIEFAVAYDSLAGLNRALAFGASAFEGGRHGKVLQ